ncbi:DUF4139 domain-containing protein [Roseovarius sp. EL26]|uniref:DUF4139 domain-containing protein n=1 Tax=Roseovarius sp. EL26 TaxID=2126672 RepID=UPI000EA37561|nr:DUF4139 domain-containing protein [Roseovarius sp. EL26]
MRYFMAGLALLPTSLWAEDILLQSDVSAVTLYPGGATITREVPFTVNEGQHQLILSDLPRTTPLHSVRVAVDGARMGSVSARNDFVIPRDDKTDAALQAAEDKVEQLEQDMRKGLAGIERIRLEAEAARAKITFLNQMGDNEGIANMDATALRDLIGVVGDETLSALQAAQDADYRADTAKEGLQDLHLELEKARAELRALVPEVEERAMLAIAVDAAEAGEGSVTVTYNIQQAAWQPVYDLHLARDTGALALERGAFIQQSTGENWEDVVLTLSTVRPSEQTTPSEVWPWLRRIFDPEQLQRRSKTAVEEADMGAFSGQVMAEPAFDVAEAVVATAAFDGLAVSYQYPQPVSIASGADRLRVTLGTLETKAELVAQAVPLSDQTAYLMASFGNDTGELILPSNEANFYLDGRFIGRRYLDLIPAGGEADLSFGPIDGLRLTRTVLDRNEGDQGVFTRSNAFTEEVRIEVENLTGENWSLRLLDRVPYSEQEDLEIEWKATPKPTEADYDNKRGVLAWEFDLPAGQTQSISLEHSIDWPDGQILQ